MPWCAPRSVNPLQFYKERKYLSGLSMKVAIAGATGFVGSNLVPKLQSAGYEVVILTRNASAAQQKFPTTTVVQYRPLESGDWQKAIEGCDGVINLAGEPIAEKRWSDDQKKMLINSRRIGTAKIVEAINHANPKPKVLINASAIGFYGISETATFDESSPAGADFLAEICQAWETETAGADARRVVLRLGVVLGNGGALAKMLPAFKMFMGGPIGSGNQWFSWIHVDDVSALILRALEDETMMGTFNATAPNPVRMKEMCQSLGEVMGRPSWMPVPGFVLEGMLGEGAMVVLDGQKVMPKAMVDRGFIFKYPEIAAALRSCVG
jgi:uncharacterized protein